MSHERQAMRRLIRYVTCTCILHNLHIAEPVPSEWEDEIRANEADEADDPDDELNTAIPSGIDGGERRDQLLRYLLEVCH